MADDRAGSQGAQATAFGQIFLIVVLGWVFRKPLTLPVERLHEFEPHSVLVQFFGHLLVVHDSDRVLTIEVLFEDSSSCLLSEEDPGGRLLVCSLGDTSYILLCRVDRV